MKNVEAAELRIDWPRAYRNFMAGEAGAIDGARMAGYYNHNYRIKVVDRSFLLRIPIPNSDTMDLRRIDEATVLRYLRKQGYPAPRVLHESQDPVFFVHNWIEGTTLNDLYPASVPMPDWIPICVARQMARLHQIDPTPFAECCTDLATSPDSAGFFLAHYHFDVSVFRRLHGEIAHVYAALGMPKFPFTNLNHAASKMEPRRFCLCHSDIHRKNLLVRTATRELSVLDWELVLVGDPAYDIAVHFHKIRYTPAQESAFLEAYLATELWMEGRQATFERLRGEVDRYLALERVKSAVIDAYRVRGDLLSERVIGDRAISEAKRYAAKLDCARTVWTEGSVEASDPERVLRSLTL